MSDAKQFQSPPVDSDEMSFAIALFVAAARGRIAPPHVARFTREGSGALNDEPLLAGAMAVLQGGPARLPDEVPLVCAVSVLWHHYEQDPRQQAMCARLVAFHALITQRQGALAKPGEHQPEEYLVEAALSPAIVKAVASATVGEDGLFQHAEFESLVERYASGGEAHTFLTRHRYTELSVTEDVQQLSLQLLAFQAFVTADPFGATPHFRTLEQLCFHIADISGTATLHAMVSRARREALPDFPWLRSTSPSSAGFLTGLESVQPAPALHEVMRCEMAILGLLIQLLRSLLGDVVTVQLLRSLWPLANLGDDRPTLPRPFENRIHNGIRPAKLIQ